MASFGHLKDDVYRMYGEDLETWMQGVTCLDGKPS
jgi:hypothetical protein